MEFDPAQETRRTLKNVSELQKTSDPEATPEPRPHGPSYGLMLALIFVAMVVATIIAWAFTHRFFVQH